MNLGNGTVTKTEWNKEGELARLKEQAMPKELRMVDFNTTFEALNRTYHFLRPMVHGEKKIGIEYNSPEWKEMEMTFDEVNAALHSFPDQETMRQLIHAESEKRITEQMEPLK